MKDLSIQEKILVENYLIVSITSLITHDSQNRTVDLVTHASKITIHMNKEIVNLLNNTKKPRNST